jgi:hypothetical protein
MKIIKDKTIYTIQHEIQELQNLWWFCNDYLIKNQAAKEHDEYYETAKQFCNNYKFVVEQH